MSNRKKSWKKHHTVCIFWKDDIDLLHIFLILGKSYGNIISSFVELLNIAEHDKSLVKLPKKSTV